MGRIKRLQRRQEKERAQESIGVRLPLMCASEDCRATTEMGWVGEGPYPASLFFEAGWMARSDPSDGITRFYCPECWPAAKDGPLGLPEGEEDLEENLEDRA